ncbi:MAG: DUF6596 domain-containing protein [Kineosporiaceae bacterium]
MAVLSSGPGAVPPQQAGTALAVAFAQEWGRVVATLIRVTGDWSLAEDAAADAFAAAARRWPVDGVPDRPGAWLTTTARNAALDRLRKRRTEERTLAGSTTVPEGEDPMDDALAELVDGSARLGEADIPDDRLRLVFTCCHPALLPEARVALTLRTLGGLEVAEIAAAFGVGEHAMAKRLVRARGKIAHARIPYRVPAAADLPERLDAVLAVVYLIFTEGYAPTGGDDVVRVDLCAQALRLGEALAELMPADGEVWGLLALMRLHHSRRDARADADGVPVPIDEQDRRRWDASAIRSGLAALDRGRAAARENGHGPYLLQAEIAACHATGADPDRIVALYEAMVGIAPSPHARLAHAVAVGRARGAQDGLAALDALDAAGLPPHLLPAARADLLRRAGRDAEAAVAYREALALAPEGAARRFLTRRSGQPA